MHLCPMEFVYGMAVVLLVRQVYWTVRYWKDTR
jgi:hypothetical protein